MSILLRKVTEKNYDRCINLKVTEDQTNFVADNVKSIAQSKVEPYLVPLAVYNDEEIVGFSLHGKITERDEYWIVRLMIDEKFQGNGYGKQATLKLIEKMAEYDDCDEIFLSFVPENTRAQKLYSKIGFEPTGETDEYGEIFMRLGLSIETRTK